MAPKFSKEPAPPAPGHDKRCCICRNVGCKLTLLDAWCCGAPECMRHVTGSVKAAVAKIERFTSREANPGDCEGWGEARLLVIDGRLCSPGCSELKRRATADLSETARAGRARVAPEVPCGGTKRPRSDPAPLAKLPRQSAASPPVASGPGSGASASPDVDPLADVLHTPAVESDRRR